MEIPNEHIREKLAREGYNSLNDLPNNENMDRWILIKNVCGLTNSELDKVMNIRFPVKQGKYNSVSFY